MQHPFTVLFEIFECRTYKKSCLFFSYLYKGKLTCAADGKSNACGLLEDGPMFFRVRCSAVLCMGSQSSSVYDSSNPSSESFTLYSLPLLIIAFEIGFAARWLCVSTKS